MSETDSQITEEDDNFNLAELQKMEQQDEEKLLRQIQQEESSDPLLLQLSEYEINLQEKYSNFFILKELGAGGFGSVTEYYNPLTRENMAKKIFANVGDYQTEKKIFNQLTEQLGKKKVHEILCVIRNYDVREKLIFYESGICNLNEFSRCMVNRKIYWWDNLDNLKYIMDKALSLVFSLAENDVYHSDIKSVNMVLVQKDLQYLDLKFIDIGSACFTHHNIIGLTERYFPPTSMIDVITSSKEHRLRAEMYQMGRTFQEILLSSFYQENKKKYNNDYKEFFLAHFMNNQEDIKKSIQMFKQKFPADLVNLIEKLLNMNTETSEIKQLHEKLHNLNVRYDNDKGIVDDYKFLSEIQNNKLTHFLTKNDPQYQQQMETVQKDKTWWMPSKLMNYYNERKDRVQKLSLHKIAESMIPELEFFKEFELYGRGIYKINTLSLLQHGAEHVILAYYKILYLVRLEKRRPFLEFLALIDKEKEKLYKRQNIHYFNLLRLELLDFQLIPENVNKKITSQLFSHYKNDKYMTLYIKYKQAKFYLKDTLATKNQSNIDNYLKTPDVQKNIFIKQKVQDLSLHNHLMMIETWFKFNYDIPKIVKELDILYNKMEEYQINEFNFLRANYYNLYVRILKRQGTLSTPKLLGYCEKGLTILNRIAFQQANLISSDLKRQYGELFFRLAKETNKVEDATQSIKTFQLALYDYFACYERNDKWDLKMAVEQMIDVYHYRASLSQSKVSEKDMASFVDEDYVKIAKKLFKARYYKTALDMITQGTFVIFSAKVHTRSAYFEQVYKKYSYYLDYIDSMFIARQNKEEGNIERALYWYEEIKNDHMRSGNEFIDAFDKERNAKNIEVCGERLEMQKRDGLYKELMDHLTKLRLKRGFMKDTAIEMEDKEEPFKVLLLDQNHSSKNLVIYDPKDLNYYNYFKIVGGKVVKKEITQHQNQNAFNLNAKNRDDGLDDELNARDQTACCTVF